MYQREIWLAEGYTTVKVEGGRGEGKGDGRLHTGVCVYTQAHETIFRDWFKNICATRSAFTKH